MSIHIRFATVDDLPAILEIYNDAILHTTAVYEYEPHTYAMRKEWFDSRQEQGLPLWVAVEQDRVCGFSFYGPFRPRIGYRYTVENSVYVHPEHRRKGVAMLLMQTLLAHASENKVHAVVACIDADNAVSIALHERFGFSKVAHFKEVGFKFGRWLDLAFLELVLPSTFNPNTN